jgi:integrase
VRWFVHFHGKRHPAEMGAPEVSAFLGWLATERNVAAATQNQALSALRQIECLRLRVKDIDFAYRQVLVRDRKGGQAPLVRHAPARARLRHPHGAGAAGAFRRVDHRDLHRAHWPGSLRPRREGCSASPTRNSKSRGDIGRERGPLRIRLRDRVCQQRVQVLRSALPACRGSFEVVLDHSTRRCIAPGAIQNGVRYLVDTQEGAR